MRLRGVLAIVMIIAGTVVTTPVRAVTVNLVYIGALPNNPNFTAAGGGFFSAPDQPSIGLQDLTAFFFTWNNFNEGDPSPFAAGLPDLLSFSATVSGTTVTSLALLTRLVPNPNPDDWNPEFFQVTSLAQGGALNGASMGPNSGNNVGIVAVAFRVEGLLPVAVPVPSVGAGLPALLALGGFVLWARRRKFVRGPMISL